MAEAGMKAYGFIKSHQYAWQIWRLLLILS